MHSISHAIRQFRADVGRHPTTFSELWTRPVDVPAWCGPYLEERPPLDPWGGEYDYRVVSFEIVTLGADGEIGGEDAAADISSLQLNAR